MGLKILHTADWHLGSPFAAFPAEQRSFLRQEQLRLPFLAARLCREQRCDLMLLAGDIFDSPHPDAQSVTALRQALSECGVPVFISPGNHDYICPDSPWLCEPWSENVHIFTGDMQSIALPELDCRIYGAGYRSMDCPALLADFRAEGCERYCIGLFHADPTNAASPCCPVTAEQVRESGLDYLALGHIHRAGSFCAGSTLCVWPGCPMGRGWDETGDKSFTFVSLSDSVQSGVLPSGLPGFYDLTLDMEHEQPENLLPPTKSLDFYRVTLTGFCEVSVPDLQARFAHLPHLSWIDRTQPPFDPWDGADADSLCGEFFRLLREQHLQDPESGTALLAAQLAQRLLHGEDVL